MPVLFAPDDDYPPEDAARLVRRILTELGLNPEALVLPAAEVRAGLVRAHAMGVCVGHNTRARVRCCRLCGCTEFTACPDVCSWVEPDLCSSCVDPSGLAPEPSPALICEAS